MEKALNGLAVVTAAALTISFFYLRFYYQTFGIDVFPFVDVSELVIIFANVFMDWSTTYLLPFGVIYIINDKSDASNPLLMRIIVAFSLICVSVIEVYSRFTSSAWLALLIVGFVFYSYFVHLGVGVVKLHIKWRAEDKIESDRVESDKIEAIRRKRSRYSWGFLIVYSFLGISFLTAKIATYDAQWYKSNDPSIPSGEIHFSDGTSEEFGGDIKLVGKTHSHIFLFNVSDSTSVILPMDKIVKMDFKK